MGRKKKITTEANITNTLSYAGNINVKVINKKTGKIVSTKKLKNNGRWPLFKFFAYCLKGEWQESSAMRPQFIDLFTAGDEGDDIPIINDDCAPKNGIAHYANETNRKTITTYPIYTTSKITTSVSYGIGKASITLSFLIPYSAITKDKAINLICLYSNQTINQEYGNPTAFFFIPKDDTEEGKKQLGNIITASTSNSANYNLLIEWTMSINNTQA